MAEKYTIIRIAMIILLLANFIAEYKRLSTITFLADSYEQLTDEMEKQNALMQQNTDAIEAYAESLGDLIIVIQGGE